MRLFISDPISDPYIGVSWVRYFSKEKALKDLTKRRPVVPGGPGVAMAPPDFGRSYNPISTRRKADYAHQITTGTPGFSDLSTVLKRHYYVDVCL